MAAHLAPNDPVQTPLGKGVVVEVRNGGTTLVRIGGRAVVFRDDALRPLESPGARKRRKRSHTEAPQERAARATPGEPTRAGASVRTIDLHGCTVEMAVDRLDAAVNDALLAYADELHVIHGRSGGRLRSAVHRRLRELPVRSFRIDPRNPGVTIVTL